VIEVTLTAPLLKLYEYERANPNKEQLESLFGVNKFFIVIDDGLHSKDSILTTYNVIKPRT
jgi:hypothetical protein